MNALLGRKACGGLLLVELVRHADVCAQPFIALEWNHSMRFL